MASSKSNLDKAWAAHQQEVEFIKQQVKLAQDKKKKND